MIEYEIFKLMVSLHEGFIDASILETSWKEHTRKIGEGEQTKES